MAKKPRKIETPSARDLPVRDRLFEIAKAIASEKSFEPKEAELRALIDEQFIGPNERATARWHRQADEMLTQALENDARFKEAVDLAKGVVAF
jgi:hypothetical protein